MSRFTDEQLKIINKDSGDLVVTASAGSGKTSVMTERYLNLVVSGKASADDILCVTFTRLAAEELRTRLNKALRSSINDATDAREIKRLNDELDKLAQASICTIDSFCNTLVRKYFYVADVDPQFSIIDETVSAALKKTAVDELFEQLYDEDDEDLSLLLKTFIRYRSDAKLKETILYSSEFLSSEQDADAFIETSLSNYTREGVKNVVDRLIDGLVDKCKPFVTAIDELIFKSEKLGVDKYAAYLEDVKSDIVYFLNSASFDAAVAFVTISRKKPSVQHKDDFEKKALSAEIDGVINKLKALTKRYAELLSQDDIFFRAEEAGKVLKALFNVVKKFENEYSSIKADAGALDYSDLEHYAYKILCENEILEEILKEYRYVFVDEYQDTNGVQEALFKKLGHGNLFIVGDEKQSIYGFRGCDSSLFSSHIESAKEGELFSLDKNFRSTKAVVNAVNAVFSSVMTERTVGKNYSENAMVYGGLYGDTVGRARIVSFDKRKRKGSQLPEGVYSVEKHLRLLTDKAGGGEESAIRRIIDEVYGEKYSFMQKDGTFAEKTIGYGDIAVLTRRKSGLADKVVAELIDNGIPVVSDSKRSIGEYPEIRMLVSLLEALEYSFKEDYSLAAALKSPVGNLSDEELFLIRDTFKDGSYSDAVTAYRNGVIDGVSVKLNEFFAYMEKLIVLSQFEGVASLIKRMIADKRLDVFFASSEHGEVRAKRVERFITGCENGGNEYSLADFVAEKDAILENMTLNFAGGEGAVKVLDIHQSKGLEFPVVILGELNVNFFSVGRRQEIVYSRKYGVGLNYYDTENKYVYPTIVRSYVAMADEANTFRDEMRLFYVAMTRAMYALYMTVGEELPEKRDAYDIESAAKFSDFLSTSVCEYALDDDLADTAPVKPDERKVVLSGGADSETVKAMDEFLSYSYPYADDVYLSVKRTVTEIAHAAADVDEELPVALPVFASESASVEQGNAYHKFLELCSLDVSLVKSDLERLKEGGKLTAEELALLDADKLEKIVSSPVYELIKDYKLSLVPASLTLDKGSGEVLVQGVIDLLAVKGDVAIIVDYKYSGRNAASLIATYKKQLELYAYAVEKVQKLKVEKTYIFNIRTCELVDCK